MIFTWDLSLPSQLNPFSSKILIIVGLISNVSVDILLNKNLLLKSGNPTNLPQKILEKAMQKYEINIIIDLKCGKEWEEVLTCDLSYNYVKINAEYTT